MEDYTAGRKSGSSTSSLFAAQQPQQSMFGSTTGSAFGQSKPLTFGGIFTVSFVINWANLVQTRFVDQDMKIYCIHKYIRDVEGKHSFWINLKMRMTIDKDHI